MQFVFSLLEDSGVLCFAFVEVGSVKSLRSGVLCVCVCIFILRLPTYPIFLTAKEVSFGGRGGGGIEGIE